MLYFNIDVISLKRIEHDKNNTEDGFYVMSLSNLTYQYKNLKN